FGQAVSGSMLGTGAGWIDLVMMSTSKITAATSQPVVPVIPTWAVPNVVPAENSRGRPLVALSVECPKAAGHTEFVRMASHAKSPPMSVEKITINSTDCQPGNCG